MAIIPSLRMTPLLLLLPLLPVIHVHSVCVSTFYTYVQAAAAAAAASPGDASTVDVDVDLTGNSNSCPIIEGNIPSSTTCSSSSSSSSSRTAAARIVTLIPPRFTVLFVVLGLLFTLAVLRIVYASTVRPLLRFLVSPVRNVRSLGRWAVLSNVSGSVVGEAFARHLAEEGCDLILLGGRREKPLLVGLASDLDKLGYLAGHRTRIECIYWDDDVNDGKNVPAKEDDGDDGSGSGSGSGSTFWTKLDLRLGTITTDGGVGLVLHCTENCARRAGVSRKRPRPEATSSRSTGPATKADVMDDSTPPDTDAKTDAITPNEQYVRRLLGSVLKSMTFRNIGSVICISLEEHYSSSTMKCNDSIDRYRLDFAAASAAYVRQLMASLYDRHTRQSLGGGIDCLSVVECPRTNIALATRNGGGRGREEGILSRFIYQYVVGIPSAETVVEASLKALGRQPTLSPAEQLFAQACRYSEQLEERAWCYDHCDCSYYTTS